MLPTILTPGVGTKVTLLLATGVSVHWSLSPPNPPVKREECKGADTLFERFIQHITLCTKTMVWMNILYDLLSMSVVLRRQAHPALLGLCANAQARRLEMVHPMLVMGSLATVLGATLRLWCFKTMGQYFTFEVTIQPHHELITTGPYAWIRHPSYTGIFLTLLGATSALCSPGLALQECGGLLSPGHCIWLAAWIGKCIMVFKGTFKRLKAEDDALRGKFGKDWDEYKRRVPRKLIPGVL